MKYKELAHPYLYYYAKKWIIFRQSAKIDSICLSYDEKLISDICKIIKLEGYDSYMYSIPEVYLQFMLLVQDLFNSIDEYNASCEDEKSKAYCYHRNDIFYIEHKAISWAESHKDVPYNYLIGNMLAYLEIIGCDLYLGNMKLKRLVYSKKNKFVSGYMKQGMSYKEMQNRYEKVFEDRLID